MIKISIIVATFNASATLQRCINSISSQSHHDIELIIIDGGSSDGTLDIIKHNQCCIDHWISEKDDGIYHAWNKGLNFVSGDWVYFLGADDELFDKNTLLIFSRKISQLAVMPLIAYGKVLFVDEGNVYEIGKSWDHAKRTIFDGMSIPHQGVFHHKDLFNRLGKFDTRFQIAGDYFMTLCSLKFQEPFFIDNFVVAKMYAGGKSSNKSNRLEVIQEFRLAQKMLGLNMTLGWLQSYVKALLWKIVN